MEYKKFIIQLPVWITFTKSQLQKSIPQVHMQAIYEILTHSHILFLNNNLLE